VPPTTRQGWARNWARNDTGSACQPIAHLLIQTAFGSVYTAVLRFYMQVCGRRRTRWAARHASPRIVLRHGVSSGPWIRSRHFLAWLAQASCYPVLWVAERTWRRPQIATGLLFGLAAIGCCQASLYLLIAWCLSVLFSWSSQVPIAPVLDALPPLLYDFRLSPPIGMWSPPSSAWSGEIALILLDNLRPGRADCATSYDS